MSTVARLARILIATIFAGMGVLHFTPAGAGPMRAMIPPKLRGTGVLSPESLVAFTGACELAGAAGILVPRSRRPAGAALIAFLAAVFPANAYAARYPERFGAAAIPFGRRLVMQLALMALVAVAAFTPSPSRG